MENQIKKEAEFLVNSFRNMLMDEDTDCGNEILCTLLAVKQSKFCIEEKIKEVNSFAKIYDAISYPERRINFLQNILIELDCL